MYHTSFTFLIISLSIKKKMDSLDNISDAMLCTSLFIINKKECMESILSSKNVIKDDYL